METTKWKVVNPEFYSVKEFALKLGVHINTIYKAIKSGRISGFRVGSGKKSSFRIPASEINRIALFDMEQMVENIIQKRIKEGK